MSELQPIDFRIVCQQLYGSHVERHALDLRAKRLELAIVRRGPDPTERLALVFEGITQFRWQCDSPAPYDLMELSIVGLERLAADDVWRLYLNPCYSATLELSCTHITCGGAQVQGVGRHYQDARPSSAPHNTEHG
jgi:hypothetical protein